MPATTSTAKPANTAKGSGHRAGLDRNDVVDAALALVEQGGASALTMRRLAADLDVATTTIYWHVGGRDELILALIARLSEQQGAIEIEGATPRERVMSVARHVWASALSHRNVTSLAHQVGATSLLEMPLELALARELGAAGLRGGTVRDAQRAILMCVAGFLVVAFREDHRAPDAGPQGARVAGVVDEGIDPATVEALQAPPDLPALFETTLQAVIDNFVPAHRTGARP